MILYPRGKLVAPRNPKVLITYYMDDLFVPGFWGTVGVYSLIWSRLDFVLFCALCQSTNGEYANYQIIGCDLRGFRFHSYIHTIPLVERHCYLWPWILNNLKTRSQDLRFQKRAVDPITTDARRMNFSLKCTVRSSSGSVSRWWPSGGRPNPHGWKPPRCAEPIKTPQVKKNGRTSC